VLLAPQLHNNLMPLRPRIRSNHSLSLNCAQLLLPSTRHTILDPPTTQTTLAIIACLGDNVDISFYDEIKFPPSPSVAPSSEKHEHLHAVQYPALMPTCYVTGTSLDPKIRNVESNDRRPKIEPIWNEVLPRFELLSPEYPRITASESDVITNYTIEPV
jgi:hypothetical protein